MTTHKDVAILWRKFYPHADPELIAFDVGSLADLDPAKLVDALQEYRRSDPTGFPPSPGKLRLAVEGDPKQLARDAWEACRELARERRYAIGLNSEIQARFLPRWAALRANPATLAAIEAVDEFGGFSNLSTEDMDRARRAFASAWQEQYAIEKRRLAEIGSTLAIGGGAS